MTESKTGMLLFGANGQLGTELQRLFRNKCDLTALTRTEADFTQPGQLRRIISDLKPAVILNAAAYTAVDRAETEPELAAVVNCQSPAALAQEAARYGGLLIHYSTDYVFDGSKATPWTEDDATNPLNVYGRTKRDGEKAIALSGCASLIFRTSWVFAPHGRNFLLTILRLAHERDRLTMVADQIGAPTSARAIAAATVQVLNSFNGMASPRHAAKSGVYHMTCAGKTSWHGFAQAILEEASSTGIVQGKLANLVPIATSEFPTPARRPSNSVLDNSKLLRQFGIALPTWREALKEAVLELRSANRVAV